MSDEEFEYIRENLGYFKKYCLVSNEEFEIIEENWTKVIKYCLENPDDIEANQSMDDVQDELDSTEPEMIPSMMRRYYGENGIKNNLDFLSKFKEALEK